MNDLVSIIIPCYRQAHLLPQAVDSVLRQSYPHIEPIVINDGSDDNTDEVARSYGDSIRYVEKANGGLPAARNSGIEVASGKYLLCLDSDDMIHENAIEWLVDAANGREDVLCMMGYRIFINDLSDTSHPGAIPPNKNSALPDIIHFNFGPPHSHLAPTSLVRSVGGFCETLRSCEDWDMWTRLSLAGAELVPVRKVGALYRDVPNSMSKSPLRMLENRTEVLLRLHDAILSVPVLLQQFGDNLIDNEVRVLRRCIAQRLRSDCVRRLRSGIGDLQRKGFMPPSSQKMKWLRKALYSRAEDLAIGSLRHVRSREP